MTAASKKASEGAELVLQAEKYLKTSFLKWKPDYELAADCYTKAATCYKNAKELEQSKNCLYKAADCYKQTRSFFSAAKSLDQATLVLRELQDWKEISTVAHRACQLFQEHGSPDTAALALDKAAKIIEPHLPTDALVLFKRAVEVVMIEDRPRQAAEYASKAARLLVRLGNYTEACHMLEREMSYHQQGENLAALGRILVALVLVHLVQEDPVAASKAIQEWGGSARPDELDVALQLHQAFDCEDEELAKRALADPFIRHMDVEYSKLTRIIPLPKGSDGLAAAAAAVSAATAAANATTDPSTTQLQALNLDDIRAIDDDVLDEEVDQEVQSAAAPKNTVAEEEEEEDEGLC